MKKKILFFWIVLILMGIAGIACGFGLQDKENESIVETEIAVDANGNDENTKSENSNIENSSIENSGIEFSDISHKEKVPQTMVYMQNNGSGGNGSVYRIEEEELILVTTYHLLQDAEVVGLRFYDNTYVEGTVIGVNEKHDVGFVSVKKEEIPNATLEKIACIWTDTSTYESLVQGDSMEYVFLSYDGLFVCQESHEGTIGDRNRYVEEFDDNLIYNYCQVKPGMSGCAAVAEDGSYVGMLIGGYDNESAALGIDVIDKVYQELTDFRKS